MQIFRVFIARRILSVKIIPPFEAQRALFPQPDVLGLGVLRPVLGARCPVMACHN
jgi:hypothetical protein